MSVRSLAFIDVPFEGITLPKWCPSPLGVEHKMSLLSADENSLNQCSHISLTLWEENSSLCRKGSEGSAIHYLCLKGHQHRKQTSIMCFSDPYRFQVLSGVLVGAERGLHLKVGDLRDGVRGKYRLEEWTDIFRWIIPVSIRQEVLCWNPTFSHTCMCMPCYF